VLLLETELSNGPTAAAAARRSVSSLAEGLPERVATDLALLVSELVTNSYRHGGLVEGDTIRLRVLLERKTLRIEVADPGTTRRPAIRESAGDGGWGLRIVEQLADRWGTESGPSGTVVWFEIDSV
jgi:anti-sigma regulatory factor (Ser/Thr protein kinase)